MMAATDSFTVDHVAAACHVTARTLATWRKSGTGPPWVKFGTVVLYPCTLFVSWFEAQVHRPGHQAPPAAHLEASVQ